LQNQPRPVAKLNTLIFDQGSLARFTVVVKTGHHLQFTIKYGEMGSLIQSFIDAARTMKERIHAAGDTFAAKVAADSLSQPAEVSAVALGRDAGSEDTVLWIETSGSGAFPLRLSGSALIALREALDEHEAALDDDAGESLPIAAE
jgi:hypothetical protein